ncbi:hypothetical protein QEH42_gp251 [Microbacterium phage Pumpernickel]|uniref:Uncharacterized protein n=1 Tax=Microbacterium phage Pumpernickel TaxID=2885983 RepID=A0AAE8Y7T1_9CAUD|nr:hypothetical protein QEH42_gp251 [Microbacterium phage Pumpernickel]UDL15967.1 hypothetical protein SEA_PUMPERNICKEL_217 [Microbacterium phage Pumpernickel]
MFPEGITTREIEVGPASDLINGTHYTIRVMVAPSRSLVWEGSPVVPSLKVYTIPAGDSGLIELPVTNQNGYSDPNGNTIEVAPDEHAFYYKINVYYLRNGSVVKTKPAIKAVLPEGSGPVDIDEMIQYSSGNAGGVITIPDTWSVILAESVASAASAEEAAEAAQAALEEYLSNPVDPAIIGAAVNAYFAENPIDAATPEDVTEAIQAHENDPTPHKAYDLDIPSLSVMFENGLV